MTKKDDLLKFSYIFVRHKIGKDHCVRVLIFCHIFYAKSKSADWLATRFDRRRGTCCVTVSSKQVQVAWNQINGFPPKNFEDPSWWKIWMIRLHCTRFLLWPDPKQHIRDEILERRLANLSFAQEDFFTDLDLFRHRFDSCHKSYILYLELRLLLKTSKHWESLCQQFAQ